MIEIHPDIKQFFEKKFNVNVINNCKTLSKASYWYFHFNLYNIYIVAYYPDEKEIVYSIDNFYTTEYTEAEMLKVIKMKAFL